MNVRIYTAQAKKQANCECIHNFQEESSPYWTLKDGECIWILIESERSRSRTRLCLLRPDGHPYHLQGQPSAASHIPSSPDAGTRLSRRKHQARRLTDTMKNGILMILALQHEASWNWKQLKGRRANDVAVFTVQLEHGTSKMTRVRLYAGVSPSGRDQD